MTGALLLRLTICWLLLCALLVAVHWSDIAAHRFPDPDDSLRLVQVRDLLAGQSWFDVHQYRVAAPAGVPMHWTRLVDVPIAGLILLLRPLLGQPLAETVTCILVPLLTLLAAVLLAGRLAAKYFNHEIAGLAALTMGLAAPAMFQFQPMRIDHHAWQIVLALAALNGLAARDARKGGLVIGLSLATSLAISLENLPLAAVFIAVCGVRFLRDPSQGRWLLWSMNTLAGSSIALFLGTRGLYDLGQHCDAISPFHLAVFAWGALGCSALVAMKPRRIVVSLVLAGAIGAGAILIVLAQAPECTKGAFAALDPIVRKYWYNAVLEGKPVWDMPPAAAVTMVALPLFGLIATLRLALRATSRDDARWWIDYSLLLGGSIVIGVLVARASATACLLAVAPAAWQLRDRLDAARAAAGRPGRQALAYLGVALLLFPSIPVFAIAAVLPGNEAEAATGASGTTSCDYDKLAAGLNRLPATDIFAPIDIGPQILVDTPHRVVATGHHRGNLAMKDVIEAFISDPAKARKIVERRHATLLVLCPDLMEPANYERANPHGLAADLMDHKVPAWLQPANIAPGSGFQVYRVAISGAAR
ncbi:hypothetical protein RXV95_01355 [Novosphingobium sp. ZN18A2]|uniref:hypothetical protein n=1 Tax=Novosphingobium sp. ZN18A2 TaxID=3079861 RepID=UPI0030D10536